MRIFGIFKKEGAKEIDFTQTHGSSRLHILRYGKFKHQNTHFTEMNQSIFKFAIAGLSLLTFGAAHAQSENSAKIDFSGSVSPVTCVIKNDDRTKGVYFGIVPPSTGFTNGGGSVGNVATDSYAKDFSLTLEGCSTPGQNGHPSTVRVLATGGGVNGEGRVSTNNDTINIQLSQPNSLSDTWNMGSPSRTVSLSTSPVELMFRSRYYVAKTPLRPGAANASLTLTMDYP